MAAGLLFFGTISAARAAATDSVIQFKVAAASVRLGHDLRIAWAGSVNGTQCATLTVTPTTDKFPNPDLASFKVQVNQLKDLWLKAGDEVKADDTGCVLLVTGAYTDATYTRPAL